MVAAKKHKHTQTHKSSTDFKKTTPPHFQLMALQSPAPMRWGPRPRMLRLRRAPGQPQTDGSWIGCFGVGEEYTKHHKRFIPGSATQKGESIPDHEWELIHTRVPQISGVSHHSETMIFMQGVQKKHPKPTEGLMVRESQIQLRPGCYQRLEFFIQEYQS